MITIVIPGEPKAKARPRMTRNGVFTPKETVNYENLIKTIYYSEYYNTKLDGPILCYIEAYFTIPKSASKKLREGMIKGTIRPTKKPDTDNLAKICQDALNGIAYDDDKQIVMTSISKYYAENPRMEISLSELEELA